jgi:hypothetical protein
MNKCLLLLLVLTVPAHALAQDAPSGNPPNFCRNGGFASDAAEFRTARVVGAKGSRAYFHGDEDEDCPSAKCRKKAYLIPGDKVIVSRSLGDWLCAWYQPSKGGETVGWIPAHRLSVAETLKSLPSAWLGKWEFYYQTLDIGRDARTGLLRVEGVALWKGFGDNIHTGAVSGAARPEGNVLVVEEDICRVNLRLVGAYLVVTDNSDCGGMNVRFDGVYRKKRAGRTPPRGRRSP